MPQFEPSRPPHRRLGAGALRAVLGLALLALGLARPVRALPDYAEHHPRLLFDAEGREQLLADILADPTRAGLWDEAQLVAAELVTWPADSLMSSYFGYRYIEELSLLCALDEGPDATVQARAVIDALLWQVENYDTEPDDFLSVLGTALRLHNLAWGWDLAGWAASESEREQLAAEMLLYLEGISTDWEFTRYLHNPYVSNKCVSMGAMLMLAVLALEPDLPGAPEVAQARAAAQNFLDFGLSQMFSEEYVYREGLGYFVWTMRTLLPTWAALDRLESRPWTDQQLRAMLESLAYHSMDIGGGRFLNRNDHNSLDFIVGRHHSLMEFGTAYSTVPGLSRWLLARSSGAQGHPLGHLNDPVATLLWHRGGTEESPKLLPPSRYYPDAGFWIHRSAWPGDPLSESFLVSLEAAEFRGGHAQEDVGQIILRAFGHGFALDHGAGNKAKQTQSHNLPLIAGKGQHNAGSSIGTDGKLHRYLASPRWEVLRADMTQAYNTYSPFNAADWPVDGTDWSWGYDGGNPMRRAWRELLLLPGDPDEPPTVWLWDRLEPDRATSERIAWRLHLDEDLVVQHPAPELWRAEGVNGALRMQLHAPASELVDWSVQPYDNEGTDPNSQVLEVGLEAGRADFLWQLTPLAPGAEEPVVLDEMRPGGHRIYSTRGNRERKLLLRTGEGPFQVDMDLLDGDWGLIEREGVAKRLLLVNGDYLMEDGELLFNLAPRMSASVEGDTVRLATWPQSFQIRAPQAQAVRVGRLPVYFKRVGDYILGPLEEEEAPDEPQPLRPWPNPGPAPVHFSLGESVRGRLRLEIFDLQGRRVCDKTLGEDAEIGRDLFWDGCDAEGRTMPSGVYLARARGESGSQRCKFVLLRR